MLAQYNTDVDDAEVREEVKKIIAEKAHENDTPEVKKFLLGSVELTTLHTTDSDVSVMQFTENVNRFDEVYPDLPHVRSPVSRITFIATACPQVSFSSAMSSHILS